MMRPPEPGRYRHYRGGEYDVVSVAEYKDRDEQVVVYRDVADGHWYVRSVRSWNSSVPMKPEVSRFVRVTKESV